MLSENTKIHEERICMNQNADRMLNSSQSEKIDLLSFHHLNLLRDYVSDSTIAKYLERMNFLLLSMLLRLKLLEGCQEFNGIGDSSLDWYTEAELSSVPNTQLDTFVGFLVGEFLSYEPPIQARVAVYDSSSAYSVLSAYESFALELFGRVDVSNQRRFCETRNINNNGSNTQLFTLHRNVALWYTLYYSLRFFYSESTYLPFASFLDSIGLDSDICDDDKYYASRCFDSSTPWGLSFSVVNEVYDWSLTDGWNADGSYSREVNKIPYQDYRDEDKLYTPKNNPWALEFIENWQPLLETDKLGFVYYQEHVVPHIGYTGRSFMFSNEEICERSREFKKNVILDYDYDNEISLLLDRLVNLTDSAKMEIELFDIKLNLGIILIRYQLTNGIGSTTLEFWKNILVYQLTTYESTLAVWKEKVDYDRVRPTSIIHELLKDEAVTTYGGVTANGESVGTTSFPGDEFEAYIRTMPHSEYPSASACICTAWAQAMQELFGTDDLRPVVGQDGLEVSFAAKSSVQEPLSTPSEDISVFYKSWSEIGQRCGETRLEGGMHFTDSVPNGAILCQNIGVTTANYMESVYSGIVPDYVIDIKDFNLNERNCYPKNSENSMSSSSEE